MSNYYLRFSVKGFKDCCEKPEGSKDRKNSRSKSNEFLELKNVRRLEKPDYSLLYIE